ncbi:Initiation-specific alpha-1,6-mannosyltransferase, partial [Colletotrichum shisoi]
MTTKALFIANNSMSALLERVVRYCLRVPHRARLAIGLALILLSGCWLYGNSIAGSIGRGLLNSNFTSRKNCRTCDDNPRRSDWAKPRPGHSIPPKIWQIALPKDVDNPQPVDPDTLAETKTWLAMNQDYTYTLVGENGSRDFVQRHFGHNATIVSTYHSLPNVGMESDMLRYLLLDVEGGVYTDTDTIAHKPIDDWVPRDFLNRTRLVVGIEFDQRDGPPWVDIPHALQFCQWTIGAAPGHPVFQRMVSRVVRSLKDLERAYSEIGHDSTWKPTSFDVMNSTGPAAWTDVVWEYLQETDRTLTDLRNL